MQEYECESGGVQNLVNSRLSGESRAKCPAASFFWLYRVLKFYDGIYSDLPVNLLKRFHDVCLVWTSEVQRNELVCPTWTPNDYFNQLGHRILRILLSSPCQPYRLYRKRRSIQSLATQSHPRGHHANRFRCLHDSAFQDGNIPLEPRHRFCIPSTCRILYIQKVNSNSAKF